MPRVPTYSVNCFMKFTFLLCASTIVTIFTILFRQGDDIPSLVWHSSNIRIETLHSDWQEIRETKFAEFSNDTYKPKYFVYSAHLDIYKFAHFQ